MFARRGLLLASYLGAVTVSHAGVAGQKVGHLYHINGQPSTVNNLGYTVTGVGDMNKDGYDDFAGGAPGWDVTPSTTRTGFGSNEGRAFVFSGRNGTTLLVLDGENPGDGMGQSMAGAGDVNKDGFPDVIVSAPGWDDTQNSIPDAGKVYVVSGLWIALQSGPKFVYAFNGAQGQNAYYGLHVANAGDLNRDTHPDILVGEPWWSVVAGANTREGRAYVYSGMDGKLLYTHTGITQSAKGERLGDGLAGVGDINLDRYDDYMIGNPAWDNTTLNTTDAGRAILFSGATGMPLRTFEGKGAFENLGSALGGIKDVNNDSFRDLVVASPTYSAGTFTFEGKIAVYSGLDGKLLHGWTGPTQSMSGISVATIDDITGDGLQDIVVGAFRYDAIGSSRNEDHGRVNILSGKDSSIYTTIDGENSADWFGYDVSSIGDANGDGVPDFIASARLWDLDPTRSNLLQVTNGRLYVYSGAKLSLSADQHLHSLSSTGPGTTQNFSLTAGVPQANRNYILATSQGTGPIQLGSVKLPLSVDPWLQLTLPMILGGAPFFPNWVGKLDGMGEASTSWTLPPSANTSLIGITLWQAYVVWHNNGTVNVFDMGSNAVPITLIK